MLDIKSGVFIRWGVRMDLPRILEIDAASRREPWTEEDFLASMRRRDTILVVAERAERVMACCVYRMLKHQYHVVGLAVDPACRRQGIGSAIMRKLQDKLPMHRRRRVTFDVPESSLETQLFLRALGFKCVRIRRAASGADDNVYRMVYERAEMGKE